jgi:hypothetical protein
MIAPAKHRRQKRTDEELVDLAGLGISPEEAEEDMRLADMPEEDFKAMVQNGKTPEVNQDSLPVPVRIDCIRPAPENDQVYRPVDPNDPDILALAESIREFGVKVPLVVTYDGYLLSGHRRWVASRLAGLKTVPCCFDPIYRLTDGDGPVNPEFLRLLTEYNRHREKSLDEKLREQVITADPHESYESLLEYRRESARIDVATMVIPEAKRRKRISPAKAPFLAAIQKVIAELQPYWPLSDRRIFYALFNDPPLIHASKPKSRFRNHKTCYNALTELLTRARLTGEIPFDVIADETRTVETWIVHRSVGDFLRGEIGRLFKGYWRDLMASQPLHIEIIGEKNTLAGTLRPVASEYCIPLTLGRGFCSLPPREKLARRFAQSGKEKLLLLVASDFDPEGEVIATSFARSMRDDFGIASIEAIKVALTAEQVAMMDLPPGGQIKGGKNAPGFKAKYGDTVYELESLPPDTLQRILRQTIDSVIDIDLFNQELAQEQEDAAKLENVRRRVQLALAGLDLESEL